MPKLQTKSAVPLYLTIPAFVLCCICLGLVSLYFSFNVTYQNHGPYPADSFRSLDEPVILVFFGDHKPWLGEQSITYASLGIDITSDTDDSFYNYYATDYLIWANDAAKEVLNKDFTGIGPDISPCFLMNVLFARCGWEGPGYTKLTDTVLDAVPMLHASGRYLLDGTLTDALPADRQALTAQMEQIQYYLTQDANGVHP